MDELLGFRFARGTWLRAAGPIHRAYEDVLIRPGGESTTRPQTTVVREFRSVEPRRSGEPGIPEMARTIESAADDRRAAPPLRAVASLNVWSRNPLKRLADLGVRRGCSRPCRDRIDAVAAARVTLNVLSGASRRAFTACAARSAVPAQTLALPARSSGASAAASSSYSSRAGQSGITAHEHQRTHSSNCGTGASISDGQVLCGAGPSRRNLRAWGIAKCGDGVALRRRVFRRIWRLPHRTTPSRARVQSSKRFSPPLAESSEISLFWGTWDGNIAQHDGHGGNPPVLFAGTHLLCAKPGRDTV